MRVKGRYVAYSVVDDGRGYGKESLYKFDVKLGKRTREWTGGSNDPNVGVTAHLGPVLVTSSGRLAWGTTTLEPQTAINAVHVDRGAGDIVLDQAPTGELLTASIALSDGGTLYWMHNGTTMTAQL